MLLLLTAAQRWGAASTRDAADYSFHPDCAKLSYHCSVTGRLSSTHHRSRGLCEYFVWFVNEKQKQYHFNRNGLINLNMGNCLSEVRTRRLAALASQLDFRIKHGSLDDVEALLRRGAPVNGIRQWVDVASLIKLSAAAVHKLAVLYQLSVGLTSCKRHFLVFTYL